LPGVNILRKGTSSGTVTDIDGNYRLSADANDTLVFSFIGYENQEVPIGGRSQIDVGLGEDVETLSEVVVIGYGTQQEKDLTSAISTVRSEDIVKTPTGQAMQALQGKVAGLQIVSSGAPGDAPAVRVRGI